MKQHSVSMAVLSAALMLALPVGCAGDRQMHASERGKHASTSPSGQMRGHGHGQLSFSPLDFKSQLKLSKEQQEAIEPIESQYKKTTYQKESDIRVAFVELGSLLQQPSPDAATIKQKVKTISDLREDLMTHRIDTLFKLRSVLTPEQQDQYRHLLTDNLERLERSSSQHGRQE